MVIKITQKDLIYDPETQTYTSPYWIHLRYRFFIHYDKKNGVYACYTRMSEDIKDRTTWGYLKERPYAAYSSAIRSINRFLKKKYGGHYLSLE
jgi:hypothetical protein